MWRASAFAILGLACLSCAGETHKKRPPVSTDDADTIDPTPTGGKGAGGVPGMTGGTTGGGGSGGSMTTPDGSPPSAHPGPARDGSEPVRDAGPPTDVLISGAGCPSGALLCDDFE